MLVLNLDFVFLIKGFLCLLLLVALLLSRLLSRSRALMYLALYLGLSSIHAWVHMGTLGTHVTMLVSFLLHITQISAWMVLILTAVEILSIRFSLQNLRWVLLVPLVFSIPLFFPQFAALHFAFHFTVVAFFVVSASIVFLWFPPLYDQFKKLQRVFFLFLVLPEIISIFYPLQYNSLNYNIYLNTSFWLEVVKTLFVFATFITLHVLFLHIRHAHASRFPATKHTTHMKILVFLIFTAFLIGNVWAYHAAKSEDQNARARLLHYLNSAKLAFSPREIALLAGTQEDMTRILYRDIKARLQELVTFLPDIRFVYLMARRGHDVIFLADSAPDDSSDASLPGQVYTEASKMLRSVLLSGHEATEGPIPDRYGVWVSAFVPIRDENRGGWALLGMDVDARDWNQMLFYARRSAVLVIWLVAILVLGIFLYIRKIIENQEHLVLSEHKYRILFEEFQDASVLLQDVFIDCNTAAERLFRCSREEIIGRSPWDFSPERQPDGRFSKKLAQEYISRALAGKPQKFAWIHRNHEGNLFHTEVSLHLLPMEPCTIQIVIRDRTDEVHRAEHQRKMETRMAEMQKWEGLANLAGGVAHDFNNLLTNIVGNVHLAQIESGNPQQIEQCYENILESARMATDLARQMLAYAGKGTLSVRPFSLSKVLVQMEKILHSLAAGRVRIEMQIEENLPALLGDATQIQQVVLNLFMNATEAIKHSNGQIRISLTQQFFSAEEMQKCIYRQPPTEGQYLVLQVQDNGDGIAPDVLPRIFEPFFTTKFTGRGLGLAATAGIIHHHGGAIRVFSTPGKGTTFEVRLPATKRKSEPKTFLIEGEETLAIQPLRILVVEDEDNLRQLAVRVLERQGHTVIAASDGVEGLTLARQNRGKLDLVFADVLMPRMDGIMMARNIREEFPDLPILITSGHVPQDSADYLLLTNGFLPKPYHYKELLKKIYETITSK